MRASTNARWIGLAQGARIVTQLAGMSVLGRLLRPDDFGVMAMAAVVTNLAGMLRDMGTGAALIQKETLAEDTISAVFWLNLGLGLLVSCGLLAFAPLIALGFRAPSLTHILWALAPSFLIASSATAHQALLERSSNFKALAAIDVSSAVIALGAAVGSALLGAGPYSLVFQTVVGIVLSSAALWLVSRWRPTSVWSFSELRGLFRFSGNLATFNFINYFSRNADNMVIGRYMGAAELGTYSIAYRLMLFPLQNLTGVASRALFPVLSRQQGNVREMASLYLRAVRIVATVTAPMMLGLLVVRAPFVRLLFGPQWADAAEVLAWLAPVGFIQSIVSTTGTVFMATGRTDILLRLGILSSVLQVGAFLVGVHYSVVMVAALYCVANVINAFPALIVVMRQMGAPVSDLLAAIAGPVASALIMAATLFAWQRFSPAPLAYWRAQLVLTVLLGAATYGGLLYLVFRQSPRDLLTLLRGRQSPA